MASLTNMLTALGLTPSAGMSFSGNVPGATSGAKFTDYILSSGSWDTQTFSGLHNPNDSYVCTLTLTEGSRAFNFRTGGGAAVLSLNNAEVVKASESFTGANTGTATTTVDGALDLGGAGVSGTLTVPTSPIAFGSGGGVNTVHFIVSVNTTASGDTFMGWHFTLQAAKAGYPFNAFPSGIASGSYSVDVRKRAPSTTDYDFEWYNDAGFTSFYDSGSNVLWTQPSVGADKTLWVQWRIKPALNGGATTYTQRSTGCVFTDNR